MFCSLDLAVYTYGSNHRSFVSAWANDLFRRKSSRHRIRVGSAKTIMITHQNPVVIQFHLIHRSSISAWVSPSLPLVRRPGSLANRNPVIIKFGAAQAESIMIIRPNYP